MSAETHPAYPGPVWQREGYASEQDYLDDAYRKLFGTEPRPLPTTRTRQIASLELPGVALTLDQRQVTATEGQAEVLDGGGQINKTWIFQASLRQPRVIDGFLCKIFGFRIGHNASPSSVDSTPTVGETAAPDDVLRASSGAAIQGGDR
ncbi:hypothetical protein [Mycobacteroides abscessus]|uniref:hypothetical protein n=1 Tax=Mycobacteroides abscessus TaxID=36809 RepID=UPI00092904A1|nr:hypothetical protein [Mycobacteroides abscessus]QST89597.1 hypothetical protein PROPHIGD62-3_3 [Mycobacterium phage prophi62-3]QST89939.1 hypothetical protein PROPHIGD108-1_3 [Mycobacterium phage prophi108-1]MBN7454274.1 hypothetical protein [Mycobacteroides abscessus subsp. abscessus]MBN7542383.1 hypothetical protein [Mycobacteroides abscessus subsp. abscessus]MBN7569934.1 hypothetical protein [Mycobacteroides abscessus subsp. abscessus]